MFSFLVCVLPGYGMSWMAYLLQIAFFFLKGKWYLLKVIGHFDLWSIFGTLECERNVYALGLPLIQRIQSLIYCPLFLFF